MWTKSHKCLHLALVLVGAISVSSVSFADSIGFSDVDSSNPYAAYIQDLQTKGAVEGTRDEKFSPIKPITRAEFVKVLITAYNLPLDTNHIHFRDVNGHWAAAYIQTAWANGIADGVTDDTFSPDVPIKREEAATIVWRYLKAHNVRPSVQNFMLPNTVDEWAREGVAQSIAKKLWGIPFKTGNYQDTASRQEAAALIDITVRCGNACSE